jgi:TorA maturation chaperone TorD
VSARLATDQDGELGGGGDGVLWALRSAVAADLRMFALLHNRELDGETILSLWQDGYEDFLGLRLVGEAGRRSLALFRAGLTDIPAALDQATLDLLAADYADIYLTHALHASPCESVWLDEDGLAMQGPMFDLRAWYGRHGLAVANWRNRSDDHLVYQLLFLAHLLEPEAEEAQGEAHAGGGELAEVARFLDEHLLLWIDRFAERVANRCQTRLYAGLALLTSAYLDELRAVLVDVAHVPRPTEEEIEARQRPRPAVAVPVPAPSAFVPGSGPTW